MSGVKTRARYVGSEADKNRGTLNLSYPIKHGVITDWDMMELIWMNIFEEELRLDPSDHPIMLTNDAPMNPKLNREKMVAPERKYSAWIGGSIAASLSTFASTAITEEEYRDEGPSIVHRKCF